MKKIQGFLFLFLLATCAWAKAGERWSLNITPQATSAGYSSSPIREKMYSEGVLLNLQYLERRAILFGYFPLQLNYKYNIPSLHQTTDYLSFREFRTPDFLRGLLTLRLDGYRVTNNDPTHETDDVNVIEPMISYINYAKTYYLDFGYTSSWYGQSHIGNGGLRVIQYTPTFGLGFNNSTNWVRFRLYEIYTSNYIRSQEVTHTNGLEVTLTHYLLYYPFFIPNKLDADFFIGQRTYAVDSDALLVYNLGDIQKNGVYLQAQWRLSSYADFIINGGHFNFTTLINNSRTPYALNYIFAGITFKL